MYNKPISYSGKSLYKKCPKKWAWQYIDGNREEAGPAAARGTVLHTLLENFFRGENYPRDSPVLSPWRRFMEMLTLNSPSPEAELAVFKDWSPTTFEDNNAYYRGKADLKFAANDTLEIYDWKSGKIYPEHEDQGKSYVAMVEDYPKYKVSFVYLDHPTKVISFNYTQEEKEAERIKLVEEIEIIRNDEKYEATPSNDSCRYCCLSWRRGGDCSAAP